MDTSVTLPPKGISKILICASTVPTAIISAHSTSVRVREYDFVAIEKNPFFMS